MGTAGPWTPLATSQQRRPSGGSHQLCLQRGWGRLVTPPGAHDGDGRTPVSGLVPGALGRSTGLSTAHLCCAIAQVLGADPQPGRSGCVGRTGAPHDTGQTGWTAALAQATWNRTAELDGEGPRPWVQRQAGHPVPPESSPSNTALHTFPLVGGRHSPGCQGLDAAAGTTGQGRHRASCQE